MELYLENGRINFIFPMNEQILNFALDHRLSQAEVRQIARQLHHDKESISLLCDCLLRANDSLICTNAARILSGLQKEDRSLFLSSRYDEMVCMALSPDIPVRLGLLLSILKDLSTEENFRADLLDFCMKHLADRHYTAGTRSYMIHLAARLCCFSPLLAQELILCLDFLKGDVAPSIVAARRNALKKLFRCCKMNGLKSVEEI